MDLAVCRSAETPARRWSPCRASSPQMLELLRAVFPAEGLWGKSHKSLVLSFLRPRKEPILPDPRVHAGMEAAAAGRVPHGYHSQLPQGSLDLPNRPRKRCSFLCLETVGSVGGLHSKPRAEPGRGRWCCAPALVCGGRWSICRDGPDGRLYALHPHRKEGLYSASSAAVSLTLGLSFPRPS